MPSLTMVSSFFVDLTLLSRARVLLFPNIPVFVVQSGAVPLKKKRDVTMGQEALHNSCFCFSFVVEERPWHFIREAFFLMPSFEIALKCSI
jgi:hypothetical protein